MERKYRYRFENVDEEAIEKKHGKEILEQLRFVFKYINGHLMHCVKTNFEFILHDANEEMITLTSGEGGYKFLATYDCKGNSKIRRFFGQSHLDAKQESVFEEATKKMNENALFEFQKKIRSKHRPGKEPKSNTEGRELSSKGLLCMKAAFFVNEKEISQNVEIALFDGNDDLYILKCGNLQNKVLATFDNRGNPKILHFVGEEFSLASEVNMYLYTCTEISKTTLGKLIVQVCGNEGAHHDENSEFIRQLLQSIITYRNEEKDKVWKNAEITIYDKKMNSLKIKSGKGGSGFVASLDENGKISII